MASDQLLSIATVDIDGRRRSDTFFFQPAATLADIQTFATAFIPSYDDVVVGLVQEARVTLNLALPGPLKGAAVANGDNRVSGLFTYSAGVRRAYGQYIHGLLPTLFNGDKVDTTDLLISTIEAAFRVGLGGVAPSDGYGHDLLALLSTKKSLLK